MKRDWEEGGLEEAGTGMKRGAGRKRDWNGGTGKKGD